MVVKRPEGHKIIDQAIAAVISGYTDEALVTFPYHGLGLGDWIYIVSDIDEYNGFWYVTPVNANTFKISEYENADFVEYYQDADIDYYQTQSHEWNSIFLPIIYKVSNNKWPLNTVDSERNISSQANDNGYTVLTLSSAADVRALEYIKITGSSVDEVYQVIEETGTLLTINLPYDADNDFASATLQRHYNNYQTKVRIYAGLQPSHPWAEKKPLELVGELSLTPDENNIVTFSISDYLRNKIQIKNNTILFSLPLNLDAFTGFYIATAESYDASDNYSLYTSESGFTNDSFNGYAVAGKLPFKNVYSGDYSDYVLTDGSPALWLSTLPRLLAVSGRYFDLSFILNVVSDPTEEFTPDLLPALDQWGSLLIDAQSSWVVSTNPVLTLNAGHGVSYSDIYGPGGLVTYEEGQTYTYHLKIEADSAGTDNVEFRMVLLDSLNNVLDFLALTATAVSTPTQIEATWEFVAPVGMTKFGLAAFYASAAGGTVTILEMDDLTEATFASDGGFQIIIKKYISTDYYLTETIDYASQGVGVYRIPFIPDSQFIKYCVQAYTPGTPGMDPVEEPTLQALASWSNGPGGSPWTLGANPTTSVNGNGGVDNYVKGDLTTVAGLTYTFSVQYTFSGGVSTPLTEATIALLDSSYNVLASQVFNYTSGGTKNETFDLTPSGDGVYLGITTQNNTPFDTKNHTINAVTFDGFNGGDGIPGVSAQNITEEICFDVIDECTVTEGFMPEDIRLLEDGDFRLLE